MTTGVDRRWKIGVTALTAHVRVTSHLADMCVTMCVTSDGQTSLMHTGQTGQTGHTGPYSPHSIYHSSSIFNISNMSLLHPVVTTCDRKVVLYIHMHRYLTIQWTCTYYSL